MITFNGKYLLAASQGNMRITAMSMGSTDLLGTLWLKAETKNTLLAAFGNDDGMKVIEATNAYLADLAKTGNQKAQALANYIYEDPMLVCSLGLQPQGMEMPIRWLGFNGQGYIDTGYKPKTLHTQYEVGFVKTENNGDWRPIINNENDIRFGICCSSSSANIGRTWVGNSTSYINKDFDCLVGEYYEVTIDKTGTQVNGVKYEASGVVDANATLNACINTRYTATGVTSPERSKFKLRYLKISEDGVEQRHFMPYMGGVLLDAKNGVIYENAETGTLTLSYTLPDGTPWTPLNS